MTDQELIIKVKADTDKATKELGRLTKELDKFTKNMKKTDKSVSANKKSFEGLGKATSSLNKQLIGLAATYLSFQSAKQLITTTAALEEGFLGIAKTTGLTGAALDELKDSILDLGTEMAGISLEELEGIAETAGQLGITGSADVLAFTETIAKMGATTDLTAQEAATSMATLGQALKIPVAEYENLGSAINELSNTTTATAKNLVEYTQRIAGMGKTFGLTGSDMLAFSATLKDVGISAELGGTAFSKMMMEMLKNTKSFAKVAGVPFAEFSEMIKDEPVEAINTFLEALDKLDKGAKITVLDDLKLSSSGAIQTMLKMSAATDLVKKSLVTSATAWKENTSLQKEYSVFSEGFNAQMEKVGNSVKKLAYKIGEQLLPALKTAADDFATWMNSLDDAKLAEFGDDIADVVKALASVAGAVGKFVASIGSLAAESPKLTIGLIGFIMALKTINLLLPAVGMSMAAVGGKSVALGAASAGLTTSIGVLGTTLRSIITLAGPWGIALAAMATASTLAIDAYVDSQNRANAAAGEMSNAQTQNANAMHSISDSYAQANIEVEKRGSVTKKTRDEIEAALKAEITAIEKNLKAWENNADSTEETNKRALKLAATLGDLKAQLDTLDARYTIDMEMETKEAEAAIDKVKKKAEEPVTSELGFNPDTRAADTARDQVSKPIIVPVTYVPTNSPSGGGYAGGGLVPQKLATGGAFKGSGRVPGYDASDSDKVNARLTGGEFVIKRKAVNAIGLASLNAINRTTTSSGLASALSSIKNIGSFKMPKIPGFAEGGLVGAAALSISSPGLGDLGTLTLKVGGNDLQVLAPRDVAEALQVYVNSEGGL